MVSKELFQVGFPGHQPSYYIPRAHNSHKHRISTLGAPFHASRNMNYMIFTSKIIPRPPAATSSSNALTSQIKHSRVWTDYFLNYIPEDEATEGRTKHEVNELKEKIENEIVVPMKHKPIPEQLRLIDDIQRLGVGYHFENEINQALFQIYDTFCHRQCVNDYHDLDLNHASLTFRLLRQQGFYIKCDIFNQFLDECGHFKPMLSGDVEGMLSLYEASHLRTHGDDILDEAFTFTTAELKLITSRLAHPQAAKVIHALNQPLHKGVSRLENRYFISLYEQHPCYNKSLLKFAKLDFNLLQSLHKKELQRFARWCYGDMDIFSGLPHHVREAIVETYFCSLASFDGDPQYALGRMIYSKLNQVGIVLDDLFDACDISDIELMTKALLRWDKRCVDELPENLRLIYTKVLDTFELIEQQLSKEGRSNVFHYLLESFKIFWPFHLELSKWKHAKYVPTYDSYMSTAALETGIKFVAVIGCLGIEEIATEEAFQWAKRYPKVVDVLGIIFRLMDDIAEDNPMEETATWEPSVISCYMKQHKITNKAQVYEELQKVIDNAWKDIHYAMLHPDDIPMQMLKYLLNNTRCLHVLYQKGDGYTSAQTTPMKDIIPLLLMNPIPI